MLTGKIDVDQADVDLGITFTAIGETLKNVSIPVIPRNYRVSDTHLSIGNFIGVWRSVDGMAREMMIVRITPTSGTSSTVMLSSGNDGFLDVSPLETALAKHTNAYVTIETFIDQSPDGVDITAATDAQALFAVRLKGTTTYLLSPANDRHICRGTWDISDFDDPDTPVFGDVSVAESVYTTPSRASYIRHRQNSLGIGAVFRRRATTPQIFRYGDNNSYPGMRNDTEDNYRLNVPGLRASVGVVGDAAERWQLWFGSRIGLADEWKGLQAFSFGFFSDTERSSHLSIAHTGNNGEGRNLTLAEFEFAEAWTLRLENTSGNAVNTATIYANAMHQRLAAAAAFDLTGQVRDYSS